MKQVGWVKALGLAGFMVFALGFILLTMSPRPQAGGLGPVGKFTAGLMIVGLAFSVLLTVAE